MIPQEYKNIENILESILGKSKSGMSDSGQLQFACPKCVEEKGPNEATKYNLEVNLFQLVFKCWSCSSVDNSMEGRLSKLIRRYGTIDQYKQYKEELKFLINSRLYDINAYGPIQDVENEKYIALPKTYSKIEIDTCCNLSLVNYLSKRKITQDIIDRFSIGYTNGNDPDYSVRNRLIIPSYDQFGDLNYWTGRDFTGRSKRKYYNCDCDKKNIVFQESLLDFDADIILCEGAIDCIYPPNAISLLGKILKNDCETYSVLVSKANANIIIWLDNDTAISETKNIYRLLDSGRLRGKIRYIRTPYFKDIGEVYEQYGKKGIISMLKSARKFSELELVLEE